MQFTILFFSFLSFWLGVSFKRTTCKQEGMSDGQLLMYIRLFVCFWNCYYIDRNCKLFSRIVVENGMNGNLLIETMLFKSGLIIKRAGTAIGALVGYLNHIYGFKVAGSMIFFSVCIYVVILYRHFLMMIDKYSVYFISRDCVCVPLDTRFYTRIIMIYQVLSM